MKKKLSAFVILFAVCLCSFNFLPVFAQVAEGYQHIDGNFQCSYFYALDKDENKIYTDDNYLFDFSSAPSDLRKYYVYDKYVYDGSELVVVYVLFMSKSSFEIPYKVSYEYSDTNLVKSGYSQNNKLKSSSISVNGEKIYYAYLNPLFYCITHGQDFEQSHTFKFDGNFDFSSDTTHIFEHYLQRVGNVFLGGTDDAMSEDTPDFNQDDAEYNQDLGYLSGIKRSYKTVGINDDGSASADVISFEQRILFNKLSTTDFDLTMGNSYIRVFVTPAVYDKSDKEILNCSTRYFVNQYPSKDLTFNITEEELDLAAKEFWDKADTLGFRWNELINKYKRNDTLWLQIINYDGKEWQYGGYVKLKGSYDNDNSASAETPSGDEDEYNEDVDVSEGTGGTSEDADDNVKPLHPNDSFTDFESMLDALTRGLMDFPELVGKVFSFLPKEFVTMLLAGLSCVIVLRILGR